MAELTPIPSSQRPAESGYQPVSGYAVAAMLTAAAFAIFTLVLIVVGIRQQRTPLTYEVLFLAVVGIILAVIGRSQIRNSEGTRTGLGLTALAWWICVLGGAAFFAFLTANSFFLERESKRSADAFFDHLRNGRVHTAFHDHLLPPAQRGRAAIDSPDFETVYLPGGYPSFANSELVRTFQRNGAAVEVKHISTSDVGQEANGFKSTHTYRITSPEGVFDVRLKLVAAESQRPGEKLQWFTQGGLAGVGEPNWEHPNYHTQYGRLRIELEREGDRFAKEWMFLLANQRPGLAHLMTLGVADREVGEKALQRALTLGGWYATMLPLPPEWLPGDRARRGKTGFDDLVETGFFRIDDEGNPLPADKLASLRKYFTAAQLSPSNPGRSNPIATESGEPPSFASTPTSITLGVPAELALNTPREFAPCTIGVVCTEPNVLAALSAAFAKGKDAKEDDTVTLSNLPRRDWRVVWFKTRVEPLPQAGGAAPPGRGGPGGRPPGGGS